MKAFGAYVKSLLARSRKYRLAAVNPDNPAPIAATSYCTQFPPPYFGLVWSLNNTLTIHITKQYDRLFAAGNAQPCTSFEIIRLQ